MLLIETNLLDETSDFLFNLNKASLDKIWMRVELDDSFLRRYGVFGFVEYAKVYLI